MAMAWHGMDVIYRRYPGLMLDSALLVPGEHKESVWERKR